MTHGLPQRQLPQAQSRLPLPGDRPPREGLRRGEPGGRQAPHPLRHRRRDRAAARPPRATAMHEAVDEMGDRDTFQRLRPRAGLRVPPRRHRRSQCFRARGIDVADDEVFVSDGSKCDTGNILDIFGPGNRIAVTDPVYPVYVDTNVMAGNTGEADATGAYAGLVYLDAPRRTASSPDFRRESATSSTSAYPNNPTGAVATREQLEAWVNYARDQRGDHPLRRRLRGLHHAIRRSRIRSTRSPARASARSSSAASRRTAASPACAAPSPSCRSRCWRARGGGAACRCIRSGRAGITTKFNGVSYIVQTGAEALFSDEGKAQVAALIEHYLGNAAVLREAARDAGLTRLRRRSTRPTSG